MTDSPSDKSRDGKPFYAGIPPRGIRRVASAFAEGKEKYGPFTYVTSDIAKRSTRLDKALSHINAYQCGETNEDHLARAAAQLLILMEYEDLGIGS